MVLQNGKEILIVMMIITMQGVIGMVVTVVVLMSRKTFVQNVNVRIQVQEEMMEEMTEEMMEERCRFDWQDHELDNKDRGE